LEKDFRMAIRVRNPAALRVLIGWVVVAALVLGGLALAGFLPPHPGFGSVFVPAAIAVLFQGVAAVTAVRRGHGRLAWIILLIPTALLIATVVLFFVLFAIGIS
jgi:hypothetical protein